MMLSLRPEFWGTVRVSIEESLNVDAKCNAHHLGNVGWKLDVCEEDLPLASEEITLRGPISRSALLDDVIYDISGYSIHDLSLVIENSRVHNVEVRGTLIVIW